MSTKIFMHFAADVRLIWSNCVLYNPEGTDIRIVCQKISQKFEERFENLLSKCEVIVGG